MNCLLNLTTPQLEKVHSGKVRESFRIDANTRMIVATDRLSAFDFVLKTPVPDKGAVLNQLAAFWFENTRDIIGNHFIKRLDPNISLVKEAQPIRIEMVVRGYLTGSAWRGYKQGKRQFSGASVPDGMSFNQAFPSPIVTPTTKEDKDREITPQQIFDEGWTSREIYSQMEAAALKLFARGQELLGKRGLILVDTKYEFGLIDGQVVLIDEIHTPDSSRFWSKKNYEANPETAEQLDKEYVRAYLMNNKIDGQYRMELPDEVVRETTRRYREIYQWITGESIPDSGQNVENRVRQNLVGNKIIKDGYVAIIMGSPSDLDHCKKMASVVEKYGVAVDLRVCSAHKNGEDLPDVIRDYQHSIEPGAVIAVAGRSNGLGGALAANLSVPVISCPPFSDKTDLLVNINSSLMMPSHTPAATVADPGNAAQLALRSLNLPRLREQFRQDIMQMKEELRAADKSVRGK
jgi:phosphoribosylaminoimidazole-succinocarboxamide synthase